LADLLSPIPTLHRNKYTAFSWEKCANRARRSRWVRRVLRSGDEVPTPRAAVASPVTTRRQSAPGPNFRACNGRIAGDRDFGDDASAGRRGWPAAEPPIRFRALLSESEITAGASQNYRPRRRSPVDPGRKSLSVRAKPGGTRVAQRLAPGLFLWSRNSKNCSVGIPKHEKTGSPELARGAN
jgi:hypothetical protein